MSPLFASLIAGMLIVGVSLIGALLSFGTLKRTIERHLSLLVSFSAGVFIVLVVSLLIESAEMLRNGLWVACLAAIGGFAVWAIARLIPESHHHHAKEECDDHHSRPSAKRMLLGDAVHNIGDGIVIVTAFAFDFHVGIAATAAVLIHEAAQEISEFFVLRAAGYSVTETLVRNTAVASTIFIGIAIGAAVSGTEMITGIILALASGAFAFVLAEDLVPHSLRHAKENEGVLPHALAALVGVTAMIGVQAITPHTHTNEEPHHEGGQPENHSEVTH